MPKVRKVKKLPAKIKEVKEIKSAESQLEKEIEKTDSQRFVQTISSDLKLDPSIKSENTPQQEVAQRTVVQDDQPVQPRRIYSPTLRTGDYNPSIRSESEAGRDYDPSIRPAAPIRQQSPGLVQEDLTRSSLDNRALVNDPVVMDFYEEKEKREKQRRKAWEG